MTSPIETNSTSQACDADKELYRELFEEQNDLQVESEAASQDLNTHSMHHPQDDGLTFGSEQHPTISLNGTFDLGTRYAEPRRMSDPVGFPMYGQGQPTKTFSTILGKESMPTPTFTTQQAASRGDTHPHIPNQFGDSGYNSPDQPTPYQDLSQRSPQDEQSSGYSSYPFSPALLTRPSDVRLQNASAKRRAPMNNENVTAGVEELSAHKPTGSKRKRSQDSISATKEDDDEDDANIGQVIAKKRKVSKLSIKTSKVEGPTGRNYQAKGEVRRTPEGELEWYSKEEKIWFLAGYHNEYRAEFIQSDARKGSYVSTPESGHADDPLDVTSFCPLMQSWTTKKASVRDMQGRKTLCMIDPPDDWTHNSSRYMIMLDADNNPVRDFPGAPRALSTRTEGWRLEGLRRVLGLTVQDMMARMPSKRLNQAGIERPLQASSHFTNRIMEDCKKRAMPPWNMRAGSQQIKDFILNIVYEMDPEATTTEVLEELSPDQLKQLKNINKGKFSYKSCYEQEEDASGSGEDEESERNANDVPELASSNNAQGKQVKGPRVQSTSKPDTVHHTPVITNGSSKRKRVVDAQEASIHRPSKRPINHLESYPRESSQRRGPSRAPSLAPSIKRTQAERTTRRRLTPRSGSSDVRALTPNDILPLPLLHPTASFQNDIIPLPVPSSTALFENDILPPSIQPPTPALKDQSSTTTTANVRFVMDNRPPLLPSPPGTSYFKDEPSPEANPHPPIPPSIPSYQDRSFPAVNTHLAMLPSTPSFHQIQPFQATNPPPTSVNNMDFRYFTPITIADAVCVQAALWYTRADYKYWTAGQEAPVTLPYDSYAKQYASLQMHLQLDANWRFAERPAPELLKIGAWLGHWRNFGMPEIDYEEQLKHLLPGSWLNVASE